MTEGEIKRIYEDLDTEIKIRAARGRKRYSDVVVEASRNEVERQKEETELTTYPLDL